MWSGFKETNKKYEYSEANSLKRVIPTLRLKETKGDHFTEHEDGIDSVSWEWNYSFYKGRQPTHCKSTSRELRK